MSRPLVSFILCTVSIVFPARADEEVEAAKLAGALVSIVPNKSLDQMREALYGTGIVLQRAGERLWLFEIGVHAHGGVARSSLGE